TRFHYWGKELRLKYGAAELLDRQNEYVANAALGSNDLGRARIGLELAPQPEDLHIDAAIKNVLMHTGCLQQVLAAEGPVGRIEKGRQQSVFAFGQRDLGPAGVGEPPGAPIELPAAKTPPTAPRIALRRGATNFLAPQHGADPRQKLPK